MPTAKQAVQNILDNLPDDASLEDVQHCIFVRQQIARGMADVEAGRVIDHEEVERRMDQWLQELNGRPRPSTI